MKLSRILGGVAALALMGAATAQAASLVTNGDFTAHGATASGITLADGTAQLNNSDGYITGWTTGDGSLATSGYNQVWLFPNGNPDAPQGGGWYGGWPIYGPASGYNNGFANIRPGSPIVELDAGGDYRGSLYQTLNGLTPGATYNVSFDWGGGQQTCCSGTTTEQLQVSFGGSTQSTIVWHNPQAGFSGWMHESFNFTADATSDVLSFVAVGTPSGYPPVALLSGVSASAVPEPAAWTMMIVGIGALGAVARRRRAMSAFAAETLAA